MAEEEHGEVLAELAQLRDLFQRRLLDDKIKARAITDLTNKLDGRFMLPLFRELILLLDRLDERLSGAFDSGSDDFDLSIYEELLVILQHYGLEQIETQPVFDCSTQKVVNVVELSEEDVQTGLVDQQVVRVVRKGYAHEGNVLRPEEVVITSIKREVSEDGRPARGE